MLGENLQTTTTTTKCNGLAAGQLRQAPGGPDLAAQPKTVVNTVTGTFLVTLLQTLV